MALGVFPWVHALPRHKAFDLVASLRVSFPPIARASNPIIKQFVITKSVVLLLCQWAYLSWWISIVAHILYRWVR